MKITIPILLVAATVLLYGCACGKQYVRLPDPNKQIEDVSKGRIYVIRSAAGGKGMVRISVADTKTGRRSAVIGDLDSAGMNGAEHLCWESAPGKVRVIADGIRNEIVENGSSLDINVEAGNTYYILQGMRMGDKIPVPSLEAVGAEKGVRALKRSVPPTLSEAAR